MENKSNDIGIIDVNGTLYFHHEWMKQKNETIENFKETIKHIAFNKNLTLEDVRQLALESMEKESQKYNEK